MLPDLYPLSAAHVGTAMRAWRRYADDAPPEPERPQTLHASPLLDGQVAVRGSLGAETGELLLTALRLAETHDVEGEPVRSVATRRADALGDICRFFLDHQTAGSSARRHRHHINLVFDVGADGEITRAATASGALLDGITAGRLLCDSVLHRVITRGRSAILDYGHATRAIPPPLWNVLVLRDQHCRFPGCDRRPTGARHTTSSRGRRVVLPSPATWSWCARGITTSSTGRAGTPDCSPAPSSR